MEEGAIISIFLITNQHQWSSMEVPLPCGRQQGLLYEGNSAAPPTWARALEGSPVDPATKTLFAEDQGDKESVGGVQGRWRREGAMQRVFHFHKNWKWGFFTFTKSESDSSLIFIAVIQSFASVLDEGSMPKVLAINVSKFTTSLYIAVEEL